MNNIKFSIVIPVYNVEKYIDKCLKSIYNQSYNNYEVIIVNDGSMDDSQKIINMYVNKDERFKGYLKKYEGVSEARNYGLRHVTGNYILFIDSDDFIEKDLLLKLSKCEDGTDIIKYNVTNIDENGNVIMKSKEKYKEGIISVQELIEEDFFETVWSYAFNAKFWRKYKFSFEKGKLYEDFGLIPLVLFLANKIYRINYYGYNYVKRKGSITNGGSKNVKRAEDVLYHFDNLMGKIKNDNIANKEILQSYLANVTISASQLLSGKDLDNFIKQLKQRKIYKYMQSDTFLRKLKKCIAHINLSVYIKLRYK